MSVNIACSAPECTNPVIGQCTGYKKNCGRYYCREHSSDTLCAECAGRKSADEQAQKVLQDYLHTAEKLDKEAYSVFNVKKLWIKGLKVVALLGFIGGPIVLPIIHLVDNWGMVDFRAIFGMFGAGFIAGPIWAVSVWTIFGFPVVWLWARDRREDWHREEGVNRAKEINKLKPGFLEFYDAWRKEKNQETLINILTIAGAIAAIGLAAATSESEYDRTRRAVRDELNQR